MVRYRRNRVPGGTYFFTVTLRDRRSRVLVDHIDLLRRAFGITIKAKPFVIDAAVILPEHLHMLWTLPEGDDGFATRWRAIKSRFVHALSQRHANLRPDARGSYRIWQRRYWEHTIRDRNDLNRHLDYIHYNPVKHGLVRQACDWPYSSFRRFVRAGRYAPDWGLSADTFDGQPWGE